MYGFSLLAVKPCSDNIPNEIDEEVKEITQKISYLNPIESEDEIKEYQELRESFNTLSEEIKGQTYLSDDLEFINGRIFSISEVIESEILKNGSSFLNEQPEN